MNEPRVNRKTAATVLAVALILAGFGSVRAEHSVTHGTFLTTGHTNFLDLDEGDSACFAGIAGILMQQVLWFNGQVLFEQAANGGDTWIYVTEHFNTEGSRFDSETDIERKDPSRETLYDTGNEYTFDDHNDDKVWKVRELFALRETATPIDQGDENPVQPVKKVYVWVVQVDEERWDDTIKRHYNFAMVVDTCKFHERSSHSEADHGSGTPQDGDPAEDTRFGHDPNNPPGNHTHAERPADIWIGGPPDISPIPTEHAEGNGSSTGDAGSGGDAS